MTGRFQTVLDAETGGRLTSLVLDGHELLVRRDDPDPIGRDGRAGDDPMRWGCYPMAPWAGRVRNGRLVFEGVEHQLPLGMPPHAIHGTAYDRAWRMVSGDQSRAVLSSGEFAACVIELDERWPFPGTTVRHEVTVTDDAVRLDLLVHVRVRQPVWVGWHPWFRRGVASSSDVAVDLDAEAMLARDDGGMPGARVAVPEGPLDDALVGVSSPVVLRWAGGGPVVEVGSPATDWVVFTEPEHAVCVEPQTAPPNAHERGEATVVEPGQPLYTTMVVSAT